MSKLATGLTLLCSLALPLHAQNAPLAVYRDQRAAKRYEEALARNPEKLGGKFGNSPTFVGGQAYSYEHCVKLAGWVEGNPLAIGEMSVLQLGNLWYTLDEACQFIYGFHSDPERRISADKIPVPPEQYNEDCRAVESSLHTVTHQYHDRLDQAFEALPPILRKQVQPFLSRNGHELPSHAFALWLPDEFKPGR